MTKTLPKSAVEYVMSPYKRSVYLVTDRKALGQCQQFMGEDIWDASRCAGVTMQMISQKHGEIYFVGVFDGRLCTLVHECAHVVLMLFERSGLAVSNAESHGEAYCYLLEDMFRRFAPIVTKRKVKP
jgi:hypothetical protein